MLIRRLALILPVVLLVSACLALIAHNIGADTKNHSSDGYTTRTAVDCSHTQPTIYTAWADYFAKLYSSSSLQSIKGGTYLVAFVAGGDMPNDYDKKFTLKRPTWWWPFPRQSHETPS